MKKKSLKEEINDEIDRLIAQKRLENLILEKMIKKLRPAYVPGNNASASEADSVSGCEKPATSIGSTDN
jgi:hypothetical protein